MSVPILASVPPEFLSLLITLLIVAVTSLFSQALCKGVLSWIIYVSGSTIAAGVLPVIPGLIDDLKWGFTPKLNLQPHFFLGPMALFLVLALCYYFLPNFEAQSFDRLNPMLGCQIALYWLGSFLPYYFPWFFDFYGFFFTITSPFLLIIFLTSRRLKYQDVFIVRSYYDDY